MAKRANIKTGAKRSAARSDTARKAEKSGRPASEAAGRMGGGREGVGGLKPNVPISPKKSAKKVSKSATKKAKTHLTAKELREFKEMLLRKRAELTGDVERLTDEAFNRKGKGAGEQSAMPIHMADLGSDNWEQEFTLALAANEQALVKQIDEALDRIEDKTYGICLATHKKISKARLRAKPWAKYCIKYARAREEGRAP